MNIPKSLSLVNYNYYIWSSVIRRWVTEDQLKLHNVLDICCGNGGFLKELKAAGIINSATGIDVLPVNSLSNGFDYISADLLSNSSTENLETSMFDAVFFMNSLYVLPDIKNIESILSRFDNIFISIPRDNALSLYEKRHPNKNYLSNELATLVERLDGVIYKKEEVVSLYYLEEPVKVLLGSFNRKLALELEERSDNKYYELYWIKR